MNRFVALTIIMFAIIICRPVPAAAETSKLWLSILPTDCIFEIVQDGTNEIIYITPLECGQLIEDDEDIDLPDGIKPNRPAGESTYVPFIIRANNRIPDSDGDSSAPNEDTAESSPLSHPHTNNEDNNTSNQAKSLLRILADYVLVASLFGLFIFILFKNRRRKDRENT